MWSGSESERRESGVIVRATAERPVKLSGRFGDRHFVDAGVAMTHQAIVVELPVLVAIGAEPGAGVIVKFVGEADRDAVAAEGPEFLDQPMSSSRFHLRVSSAWISSRPTTNSTRFRQCESRV